MILLEQDLKQHQNYFCVHLLWTYNVQYKDNFPGVSGGKESAFNAGERGLIPGWEDPLEKEMATHSSILAWRISGQSLVSYSPLSREESGTIEWLTLSLSQNILLI